MKSKKSDSKKKKSQPKDDRTPEQRRADKIRTMAGRETVEAFVVAFVLAFLIRTFQAEAFVIPTGSMAPTLMGRHKDVFCEQCGTRFRVNSSDDTTDAAPVFVEQVRRGLISKNDMMQRLAGMRCAGGSCPNCRYVSTLDPSNLAPYVPPWKAGADKEPDFSGDRLVVSKYSYSFADPERWDVIVFKYPGNSQTNYIKRLVGLPGDEMRIFQGDLYRKPIDAPEADYTIERKPPKQVLAMRQAVHDTDHDPSNLYKAGWPLRWSGDASWRSEINDQGKVVDQSYRCEAPAGQEQWLRYHHTPPPEPVWRRVLDQSQQGAEEFLADPSLVTDFTPYNTRINAGNVAGVGGFSLVPRRPEDFGRNGVHWVGDLMLEADLKIASAEGKVSFDVVEAGVHHGCTIDIATGKAILWRQCFESDERVELDKAATSVRGKGSHRVMLANVDNQLLLWIDGGLIETDAAYADDAADAFGPAQQPFTSEIDEGDLAPAGVAAEGATVEVERLRVWRDGYYLAARWDDTDRPFTTDFLPEAFPSRDPRVWGNWLMQLASTPEEWPAYAERRTADFKVDEDQLFVLGDNSGWSLDARLWAGGNGRDGGKPGGAYLERSQLVGKAICVYWPHAWYSLPFTNQMVPAWPNFGDMRLVR